MKLDNKKIKYYAEAGVEKGYTYEDLQSWLQNNGYDEESTNKTLRLFEELQMKKNGLELSWLEKRKIKKLLKQSNRKIKEIRVLNEKLVNKMDKINKEDLKKINKMKKEMIERIIGIPEKNVVGFINIFEITDEDNGGDLNKETLEKLSLEEITDLFENLIKQLENEI